MVHIVIFLLWISPFEQVIGFKKDPRPSHISLPLNRHDTIGFWRRKERMKMYVREKPYHHSDIPNINLIAPFHAQYNFRCPVHVWYDIVLIFFMTQWCFTKVTENWRSKDEKEWPREVDHAITNYLLGHLMFEFILFVLKENRFIINSHEYVV